MFALIEDGTIVGTVGRSRMHLSIEGENRVGYQLGAVAVMERYRGRGIARQFMEWVIDSLDAADQPIILFANRRVHDFYPRFGFQRLPQRRSIAVTALHPLGEQPLHCALSDATDRARLAALCARAKPTRGRLTAPNYGSFALWNLTCEPVTLAWLPDNDAAVAFTVEDDRLIVHDVFAYSSSLTSEGYGLRCGAGHIRRQ